jgi:hypothetical protein
MVQIEEVLEEKKVIKENETTKMLLFAMNARS